MTKCNGTKVLLHNSISLTFWTMFFTQNIGVPYKNVPVLGTWGKRYLKAYARLLNIRRYFVYNDSRSKIDVH